MIQAQHFSKKKKDCYPFNYSFSPFNCRNGIYPCVKCIHEYVLLHFQDTRKQRQRRDALRGPLILTGFDF